MRTWLSFSRSRLLATRLTATLGARHRLQPATGLEDYPVCECPDHRPARSVRLRRRGRTVPAPPGGRRSSCARRTVSTARNRAFRAITKVLKCASIRDYEQMVVVRTAKDHALATALTNRLQPLAEAIRPATARSSGRRPIGSAAVDLVSDASANPAPPGESCAAPRLHGISCCGRTAGPGQGSVERAGTG